MTTLELRYFAWVRERIGTGAERLETGAETLADLVEELRARDDRYAYAFSDMSVVRAAIDQDLCPLDTPLAGAREVAFFPPMTGG